MAQIRKWALASILLLVLAFGLTDCSLPPSTAAGPAPAPSPTKPLGAVEVTATDTTVAGTPVSSTPQAGPSLCPTLGYDPDMIGRPCLTGSQDTVYDIFTQVSDTQTRHVVSPLEVQIVLWASNPGVLIGTAHLTYKLHDVETDSQSSNCPSVEADVAAFSWDVKLSGQYFAQPDGGIQVIIQASPNQGPAYTEVIESCQVPSRQMPGVVWPGLSAELQGGVYDLRQENPQPANSSGDYYSVIHLEAAR